VTNIRKKQLKEVKDLFWHMVSEVTIHYGGEQLGSHYGGQEAERILEGTRARYSPRTTPHLL
jgi:hypothetical protein